MIPFKHVLASAGLVFGLSISACSDTGDTMPSDEAANVVSAPNSEAAGSPERRTKAELMAEFEATISMAQATQGDGSPAMWRMTDEDSTVYFFGTVHLLRPELEWRSEAFDTAFDAADQIVFEIDLRSAEAQSAFMRDFVSRGFYEDGKTLRGALDAEVEQVVEAALDSVGLPMDAVNAMEPWMTATNLGSMKLQADGYDPTSGVEHILDEEARSAGKTFAYLESVADQADAFDLLPEEDQINFLYETALLIDETSTILDQLVDEWADGDVQGLATLVATPSGVGGGEAMYQSVLVDRNKKWVPKIEEMLAGTDTVFIAVGAGHLVGDDSVIAMLRSKGYEIEKL
ncbi:MAG: TraB/GumN family protein [Henriciella sp.]|nr:TraB/GumN family protein [Henriciella sp.]